MLAERLGLSEIDVVRPADPHVFSRIVKACCTAHRERAPDLAQRLSLLAYAALLCAAKDLAVPCLPSPVRAALELMNRSMSAPLSLAQLAATAGTSVPNLCRLFRRHVGAPPAAHFLALKVRRARELLASTGARVKAIALSLGYENTGHFTRLFTKETGVMPRAYRRGAGR